ncbi:hypothetical protein BGY98DRAFT_938604 [Russula aff. rugulosa BPL654]|nr:hypothetical protein BGY98DRAFT_938604 [Russula aff. rugulosa BPL654]
MSMEWGEIFPDASLHSINGRAYKPWMVTLRKAWSVVLSDWRGHIAAACNCGAVATADCLSQASTHMTQELCYILTHLTAGADPGTVVQECYRKVVCMEKFLRQAKKQKAVATVDDSLETKPSDQKSKKGEQATIAAATAATLTKLKKQQKILTKKIMALKADF